VRPPSSADDQSRAIRDTPASGACRTESEWLASWAGEAVEPDKVPLGARVWLPREGRCGRVVVRVLDGLLYRVRLDGEPGRLREYPACELEPLD
jgi:hypothetical protein